MTTYPRRPDGRRGGDHPAPSGRIGAAFASFLILSGLSLFAACDRDLDVGPLQPPSSEAPAQNYSGFRAQVDHPFTFGLIFVKNYGGETAVLDVVELIDETPGIELVGQIAADITGERHTWSSEADFPPLRPPDREDLAGFRIRSDAGEAIRILLGVELTRPGQHGFRAVAILYHVGDEHYRYTYPSGLAAYSPSFYAAHPNDTCDATRLFA